MHSSTIDVSASARSTASSKYCLGGRMRFQYASSSIRNRCVLEGPPENLIHTIADAVTTANAAVNALRREVTVNVMLERYGRLNIVVERTELVSGPARTQWQA